jgi:peptide deformylase
VPPFNIRVFGDPVLRTPTREVTEFDGALKRLADDMLETMYAAPGVGLAANQVGIQKRMFVYDVGEGPGFVVNPTIHETVGEWTYEEGCLSVPGLYWPIVRPKQVHLTGYDLDGKELELEADDLMARMLQHECDHLDGTLLLSRLSPELHKEAMRELRERETRGVPPRG